jgi:hypothetical protein
VDLPSQQEVGWVEWRLLIQRRSGDDAWKTVIKRDPVRRTVTLGFPMTFPTQDVRIDGQTGSAPVRLVWRLNWFDQANKNIGGARHAVVNYGLVRYDYGPPTTKPITWQAIERRTKDACPNRWTS